MWLAYWNRGITQHWTRSPQVFFKMLVDLAVMRKVDVSVTWILSFLLRFHEKVAVTSASNLLLVILRKFLARNLSTPAIMRIHVIKWLVAVTILLSFNSSWQVPSLQDTLDYGTGHGLWVLIYYSSLPDMRQNYLLVERNSHTTTDHRGYFCLWNAVNFLLQH